MFFHKYGATHTTISLGPLNSIELNFFKMKAMVPVKKTFEPLSCHIKGSGSHQIVLRLAEQGVFAFLVQVIRSFL